MSRQLIVAGFHRSGTSLVCQLLHRAGLFLGYDLLGATFSNPNGHFEDAEVVELHERILADNGRTWRVGEHFVPVLTDSHWLTMRRLAEQRNAEHEVWGFKDPRVCLFLPLWKHLLPRARVLLVYRHFAEATRSLARRQAQEIFLGRGSREELGHFWREPDLALRMWLTHNEALLSFALAHPEDTLAVSLDMIRDGFPLVRVLNARWGLGLKEIPTEQVFDSRLTSGQRGKQPVSDRRLIGRVKTVWKELERLGERTQRCVEEEIGLA
ncbi:hypothetical protein Rxycam_01920 [Rubrobacter xylanophilus DSM 9941]|nr:hypothetical protein Rxycam_01920 [Rubrobacter xylanophilus DSM 9941]